jgi:NRAMP (natural resistance-associated macrophage protein)-like metal ion transporter
MRVPFSRYVKNLGPGLVTGASDDDPSGIATFAQAGAQFGYGMLWVSLLSLPFMVAVQEMCARVGLVTRKGLVELFLAKYPRWFVGMLVLLLVVANTVNLGADLNMMAASLALVLPVPLPVLLLGSAAVSLFLQVWLCYEQYARFLKWLTLSLFAYVLVAFMVHVDWSTAFASTFLPHWSGSREEVLLLIALFGTTLSPYLYFWQTDQEVEEVSPLCRPEGGARASASRKKGWLAAMRWDVASGMSISNVISWFITLTAAAVLVGSRVTNLETADQMATLLVPVAGRYASWLFSLGVVGTGLLAAPVLAGSCAYAVSELFHRRASLSQKWYEARLFYGVIACVMIGALWVAQLEARPVHLLIYAAIVNALVAPPLLFAILRLADDKKLMGKYRNGGWSKLFGWGTLVLLCVLPVAWLFWR